MKRTVIYSIVCLISSNAFASDFSHLNQCIENRKAGRLPQAEALCKEAAETNPGKAVNWYEYGNTLVEAGKYGQAEEAWAAAVKLSPVYAKKVGGNYERVLRLALKTGQVDDSVFIARRLFDYQPDSKVTLTKELYEEGVKLLNEGLLGQEKAYLTVAAAFNFSLREPIYTAYIVAGNKATEETAVFYYGEAIPYSDLRDQNIGKKVFDIGMKFAKKPGAEALTSKIRNILRQYMGNAFVENEFPEIWRGTIGKFDFSGKAGERTPFLTTEAQRCRINFYNNNDKYIIVYTDGRQYKMWDHTDKAKFRSEEDSNAFWYIKFIEDCNVTVEFSEWN